MGLENKPFEFELPPHLAEKVRLVDAELKHEANQYARLLEQMRELERRIETTQDSLRAEIIEAYANSEVGLIIEGRQFEFTLENDRTVIVRSIDTRYDMDRLLKRMEPLAQMISKQFQQPGGSDET